MLLCSCNSKEKLLELVNEYFYSNNNILLDDGSVFNKTKNTKLIHFRWEHKKGRYRFLNDV